MIQCPNVAFGSFGLRCEGVLVEVAQSKLSYRVSLTQADFRKSSQAVRGIFWFDMGYLYTSTVYSYIKVENKSFLPRKNLEPRGELFSPFRAPAPSRNCHAHLRHVDTAEGREDRGVSVFSRQLVQRRHLDSGGFIEESDRGVQRQGRYPQRRSLRR